LPVVIPDCGREVLSHELLAAIVLLLNSHER
jgi:hypothetical protein